MSKICCVCNEVKESKDNVIFNCKGQGCDVSVHQGCYGIVNVPTGLWFCRKCESQERAARVRCELCPRKEGALKRTDSGGWAHVVCALYIPEVAFGNNRIMEPIVTTKLPRERFSKSCYICEDRGNETQSTYGACMSCHKPSCRQAFHVTCAQKEKLLCEEEDPRDPRNVIYCGYCNNHHKKMLRQRHKRKPIFPQAPTSSASSLFPTTPTSSSPGVTTPLSSLPDLALPSAAEGGEGGDGRRLERTRSGSPVKVTVKRERQSLSELPLKRTLTDSSAPIGNASASSSSSSVPNQSKPKRRRRKPSSSNESTTSEAPSNSSEFYLMPASMVIPSPSLQPPSSDPAPLSGSPPLVTASSPSVSRGAATGKGQHEGGGGGGGGQKGRGQRDRNGRAGGIGQDIMGVAISQSEVAVGNSEGRVNSSLSEQSSKTQAPPPRSLQELLERQWEQTAQFILDQAGKQNNAGSMLAHLHTLQSENRTMQSRIMELASQREFYIAINTKLRQTLAEHELGHLPNGVQTVGNGLQQQVGGPGEEPMLIPPADHRQHPSRADHHHPHHHHHIAAHPQEVESPPPPVAHATPLVGGGGGGGGGVAHHLSKDDQDLLLHAHFASNAAIGRSRGSSDSPGAPAPHFPVRGGSEDPPGVGRYHPHPHHQISHQSPHHDQGGGGRDHTPPVPPPPPGSNFMPALIRVPSSSSSPSPAHSQHATPLSSAHPHHAPVLEYSSHPMDTSDSPATHPHEITQVTNSVHAPISSLTPLPKDALSSEEYAADGAPGVFNMYKRDAKSR